MSLTAGGAPIRFQSGPATIRVPATSANLGPGFDAFGLAVSRFDEVTAEILEAGLAVHAEGEGALDVARDETHLIIRAMRATFERLGAQPAGLRLNCLNRIPHGRGLGSSAGAIVAGVQLARALVVDGQDILDDDEALVLAGQLEGHPDNVAACLLGGLTIAWTEKGQSRAVRVATGDVIPVVFIPSDQSSTETARAALPALVPHVDAAFNASRAALLVVAMTARPELLMTATEDRLHQDYRAASMPASARLVAGLREAGVAAVISGAGSTVLALTSHAAGVELALEQCPPGWEGVRLDIAEGAALLG